MSHLGTGPTLNILHLADEILLGIGHRVEKLSDLGRLSRTNRRLHGILNDLLYRRDAQSGRARALGWAISHGLERTARVAIEAGTDVNRQFRVEDEGDWECVTLTPLQFALFTSKESIAQLLITAGADFKTPYGIGFGEDEQTSLQTACIQRLSSTVQLLLEKGADTEGQGDTGLTPLQLILMYRGGRPRDFVDVEIVSCLLAHGSLACVVDRKGRTCQEIITDDSADLYEGKSSWSMPDHERDGQVAQALLKLVETQRVP